ncbi:class I SAM-dependent methyltransferase [Pseudonocardia sichuanensis]
MPIASPTCRACRSPEGAIVLDLGAQPSSELFPKVDDPGPDALFPLRMWLCAHCGLAQLADDADVPEEVVGAEPAALTAQRADAVRELVAAGALPAGGTAVEFPSPHGGSWLELLAAHGFAPVAPADGAAPCAGPGADLVVDGCFGVMHAGDQQAALQERAAAVRPGGRLVVQFHSLHAIVAGTQWNALRLGHYAYYSTPAMVGLLARAGLTATTARRFPLYGGTVALVAGRTDEDPAVDTAALDAVVAPELTAGVLRPAAVGALQHSVQRTAGSLREMLVAQRAAGRRVYGYAAASRAVSLLRLADLDATLLLGVADASPGKQDRRMPGTDIPIITPDELVAAEPDVVLVFVSELVAEAKAALPQIERRGGTWVDAGAGR